MLDWCVKHPYSCSLFPTIGLKHWRGYYVYIVDAIIQSGMLDHYWKMMKSRMNSVLTICIVLTGNSIICYLTVWCLIDNLSLWYKMHLTFHTLICIFQRKRAFFQRKRAFKLIVQVLYEDFWIVLLFVAKCNGLYCASRA